MALPIELLFTPAEYSALAEWDLSGSLCVVFDVLRATSVIATALANGAAGIIPVGEISEALELKRARPDVLLGGERGGLRITSEQTGGIEFDLGNSPCEYTSERVAGKTIVTTTTNGTRALRACATAKTLIASCFLNLSESARFAVKCSPEIIHLVCAGTGEGAALEDVLAAGAFCDELLSLGGQLDLSDSVRVAWQAYRHTHNDLPATARVSLNARRLLARRALRDDVDFCLQRDRFQIVSVFGQDGTIRTAG